MEELGNPDTTALDYWLNWRFLLCAIWVLTPMVLSFYMIWRYEYLEGLKAEGSETPINTSQFLHGDEAWMPCVKEIHPIWLLLFRVFAFFLLLVAVVSDVVIHGSDLFFYYTQWTFVLVTIYFAFASVFSIYGCYKYHQTCSTVNTVTIDTEKGIYAPLTYGNGLGVMKDPDDCHPRKYSLRNATMWRYAFQIMFQMTAGSVMLTDCVYWFLIFPFLTLAEYKMSFLTIVAHSLNLVMILGDTALNSLPFPWFRISYFVLWTGFYTIFEWAVHVCVSTWWPYPILDLSSPLSPVWYLIVAVLHLPCYGIFALLVNTKFYMLSTWFPRSYRCLR
jgi:hypothetical protein